MILLRNSLACAALAAGVALMVSAPARAEDLVWATGKVLDSNERPLVGARVAVFDDADHVVDIARTDENGDYAVAVPMHVLHLRYRHGAGFVTQVFGGVTRFVSGAADAVANPLRAGVHAVTAAEAANVIDPIGKGEVTAGAFVVDRALFGLSPRERKRLPPEERKQPGALVLKVIAPDRSDLFGVDHVYWVQHETGHSGARHAPALSAWLDPVVLAPADGDAASKVQSDYMRFAGARLEPSIAEKGQMVRILARLKVPEDPSVEAVVIARNARTGQIWQLEPQGNGRYAAEFEVDRHAPLDDQTISVLAYATTDHGAQRNRDIEHALEHAGAWDLKHPYAYDPLVAVSRNRADLTLTIVKEERRRR